MELRVEKIFDILTPFIALPAGQKIHTIDWSQKPHRNLFKKNGKERVILSFSEEIYFGQTLITDQLWKAVMNKEFSSSKDANLPISGISYSEVLRFIQLINDKCNTKFRLPTEKEYLYACLCNYEEQIGTIIDSSCWYAGNSENKIHAVSSKLSGHLQLADLLGNLYQYLEADITSIHDKECVYRGACWATDKLWVDQDYCFKTSISSKEKTVGFRLVIDNKMKEIISSP
jgi:formylglycine-generating enzyme required for sulfatase activity